MVSAATPIAGIWVAFFSRCQPDNVVADRCREHGVGILAHSTLGKGLLTGRYKAGHEWSPDDERSNMVDFHGAFWGVGCSGLSVSSSRYSCLLRVRLS